MFDLQWCCINTLMKRCNQNAFNITIPVELVKLNNELQVLIYFTYFRSKNMDPFKYNERYFNIYIYISNFIIFNFFSSVFMTIDFSLMTHKWKPVAINFVKTGEAFDKEWKTIWLCYSFTIIYNILCCLNVFSEMRFSPAVVDVQNLENFYNGCLQAFDSMESSSELCN